MPDRNPTPIIKLMLKGTENTCKRTMKPTRKVVTVPILKLIGHEIAGLEWSSYSKQVYWAACCTVPPFLALLVWESC